MSLVNQEGLWFGKLKEWGVDPDAKNTPFVMRFQNDRIWQGASFDKGAWVDRAGEITAYVYVFKKDGTWNESAIEQLEGVLKVKLERDRIFAQLHEGDWSNVHAQQLVKSETFEGKTSFKVAWMYADDYVGPIGFQFEKAAPDKVKALDAAVKARMAKQTGGANPIAAKVEGARPPARM